MSAAFLEQQQRLFSQTLASSSKKLSSKSKPDPNTGSKNGSTSASMSNRSGTHVSPARLAEMKRKRDDSKNKPIVYSQPADTGSGTHIMTQVTYAVKRLKEAETSQTFSELVDYLSLRNADGQRNLAHILRRHERVEWKPNHESTTWDSGTFRFKPIHNIRSGTDLLAYLQNASTAQGVAFKDLKEGWSGAEAAVDQLEAEGKLLVTRNKKDNHARMVWSNDPSCSLHIDDEFATLWSRINLPKDVDLPGELLKAGLQPTSSDGSKKIKMAPAQKEKKQKKRRAGKVTNSHMAHVLRDYSKRP